MAGEGLGMALPPQPAGRRLQSPAKAAQLAAPRRHCFVAARKAVTDLAAALATPKETP